MSTIKSTRGVRVGGPLTLPLLGNEWFSAGVLRDTGARDAAIDLVHALRGVEPNKVWLATGFVLVPAP